MSAEDAYSRRISAILLADVSGYSALVGDNDERTARAIKQLQHAVRRIVEDAKGYADARAGDAIFASFDSVVAAVETALAIQRAVADQEFEGQRLQVRIGIHFGDVLIREGTTIGEGVGDAINIAARLQTLARPGTVCISEAVYVQVHKKFDEHFVDLGKQQLKNISYPVHAYLLIPREHAHQHVRAPRRRRMAWGAGGLSLLLLALAIFVLIGRNPSQPPAAHRTAIIDTVQPKTDAVASARPIAGTTEPIALGVMLFRSLGETPSADWRPEAVRDGLNTQLSRLSHVKVYSKEFIDFLISRKGLTEIEAATQLGIRKMLSGSVVITNGTVRIETHVVDVQTGVLESSNTTVGREEDFPQLGDELVLGVIARLEIPVTPEERKQLFAKRTDEEALKMLLEAEGAAAPPPPDDSSFEHRRRHRWLAYAGGILLGVARAEEEANTAILAVLERYRRATEARDMSSLASVYVEFPAEQQTAQQRYFDNVRDLRVVIENPEIAVVDDEAVVSYTRTDDFVDVRTGRPMHASVRLTKILRRSNGEWRMAAGK
jgi:class 3 adenylate cyclase/TolB-like protein